MIINKTPRSRIKGMLRQLFLRSVERTEAMKRDKYSCVDCGVKQSVKKGFECKIQVHHKKGIGVWDELINLIYEHILCNVDDLECLCVDCHTLKEEEIRRGKESNQ